MQLSVSSFFLDPLAAPPATAAGGPTDPAVGVVAPGAFSALLAAQAPLPPSATAVSPGTPAGPLLGGGSVVSNEPTLTLAIDATPEACTALASGQAPAGSAATTPSPLGSTGTTSPVAPTLPAGSSVAQRSVRLVSTTTPGGAGAASSPAVTSQSTNSREGVSVTTPSLPPAASAGQTSAVAVSTVQRGGEALVPAKPAGTVGETRTESAPSSEPTAEVASAPKTASGSTAAGAPIAAAPTMPLTSSAVRPESVQSNSPAVIGAAGGPASTSVGKASEKGRRGAPPAVTGASAMAATTTAPSNAKTSVGGPKGAVQVAAESAEPASDAALTDKPVRVEGDGSGPDGVPAAGLSRGTPPPADGPLEQQVTPVLAGAVQSVALTGTRASVAGSSREQSLEAGAAPVPSFTSTTTRQPPRASERGHEPSSFHRRTTLPVDRSVAVATTPDTGLSAPVNAGVVSTGTDAGLGMVARAPRATVIAANADGTAAVSTDDRPIGMSTTAPASKAMPDADQPSRSGTISAAIESRAGRSPVSVPGEASASSQLSSFTGSAAANADRSPPTIYAAEIRGRVGAMSNSPADVIARAPGAAGGEFVAPIAGAAPELRGIATPVAAARASTREIDLATPAAARAENFAAAAESPAPSFAGARTHKLKNTLVGEVQEVADRTAAVGTPAAKPEAPMPALAHPRSSVFAENDPVSFAMQPLSFDALVREPAANPTAEYVSSARRAVDSAMAVVEHFAQGTQRGVNLQFSVSGMDLAVRVELRQDGVHTIFRTDSPELRAALAQEWQTVVATQPNDRAQRLAEPVFTSTSAGGPTSGDQGASHQRESGTPHSHWEKAASFAPPAPVRANVDVPLVAPSTGPRLESLGTSRRLHTFA